MKKFCKRIKKFWVRRKISISLLFLGLLLAIFYVMNEVKGIFEIRNEYILIITALIIFWYTTETFLLRKEAQRNTKISVEPILVIDGYAIGDLDISNIGNGPALNIEVKISQFHETGGYTYLQNFLREKSDYIYNLQKNKSTTIFTNNKLFLDYLSASKPNFKYGIKNNFAIIFSYNDMFSNRYQSIIRLKKIDKHRFLLKQTLFGSFETGELMQFPKNLISP